MTERFEDQASLTIFLSIIFVLIGTAVGAYFVSSKRRNDTARRRALWVVAMVSALVAFVGTIYFAIPLLEDFRIPGEPFRDALVASVIAWAICLGAWVIAVRCVISALRNGSSR
jgi:uncharacterized membrane protein (GlpM family)